MTVQELKISLCAIPSHDHLYKVVPPSDTFMPWFRNISMVYDGCYHGPNRGVYRSKTGDSGYLWPDERLIEHYFGLSIRVRYRSHVTQMRDGYRNYVITTVVETGRFDDVNIMR